jgi:hypothetical protein
MARIVLPLVVYLGDARVQPRSLKRWMDLAPQLTDWSRGRGESVIAFQHRCRSLVVVAAAGASVSLLGGVARADSWVGDRFGWREKGSAVQATTDGGRHWREIYYADGSSSGDLFGGLQTGPRIGVVEEESKGPITDRQWTVDNGKHWYELDAHQDVTIEYGTSVGEIDGHGPYLFWVLDPSETDDTSALFQVRPWPPRGKYLACGGSGFSDYDADGLYCGQPKHPLRSVRVATLNDAVETDMANIPGGIAVLFARRTPDSTAPLFRLVISRNGVVQTMTLPALPGPDEAAIGQAGALTVDWPDIEVDGGNPLTSSVLAVWSSADGGERWDVEERRLSPTGSGARP